MSKATPGPWRCGDKGQFGTFHPASIMVGPKDEEICIGKAYGVYDNTTLEDIQANPDYMKHCAEGLANAQLMAAAPDLADALEAFVEMYATVADILRDGPSRAKLERARYALKKAGRA